MRALAALPGSVAAREGAPPDPVAGGGVSLRRRAVHPSRSTVCRGSRACSSCSARGVDDADLLAVKRRARPCRSESAGRASVPLRNGPLPGVASRSRPSSSHVPESGTTVNTWELAPRFIVPRCDAQRPASAVDRSSQMDSRPLPMWALGTRRGKRRTAQCPAFASPGTARLLFSRRLPMGPRDDRRLRSQHRSPATGGDGRLGVTCLRPCAFDSSSSCR